MNWDWMRELIKIHMVCDVVVFNGASSVLSFFATSSSLSIVSMTLKSSSSLILREILRLCRLSRMESMLCLCQSGSLLNMNKASLVFNNRGY